MKLEQLGLVNFRGFEQIDLKFDSGITVIAGVNGVGKTGILKAIASLMSYAMPKFTLCQEKSVPFTEADIYQGKSSLTVSAMARVSSGAIHVDVVRRGPIEPEKVSALNKRRDDLRFEYRETGKGSQEAADIEDEIRRIEHSLSKPEDEVSVRSLPSDTNVHPEEMFIQLKVAQNQPLIVLYPTNRFLSRLPPVLPKTKAIEVASAYAKALDQLEVSLNDFASWYRTIIKDEGRRTGLKKTLLDNLEEAIAVFLPGMSGLELDTSRPPQFSVSKNSHQFSLEQLSDGERGLLALVFDLTRRLSIANPGLNDPLAEGNAIVMIDEIELHLHPKWQREVLGRLKSVFPGCQFIVTTHSPMVLGEAEARCVRFLEYENGRVVVTTPHEAYGMDANRVLQELMDSPVRNKEIEGRLRVLFDVVDREKFDEARAIIKELSSQLGEHDPELTRASSLIHLLEGDE